MGAGLPNPKQQRCVCECQQWTLRLAYISLIKSLSVQIKLYTYILMAL